MSLVRRTGDPLQDAVAIYLEAKFFAAISGFAREARWQGSRIWPRFTETDFLREAAWVVLCSGFSGRMVRRVFSYVSLCFCDWESAAAIVQAGPLCRATALRAFKNSGKIDAILTIAAVVNETGFEKLKLRILASPVETLCGLPYVGPVTSLHLLKNLGLAVTKPDRHLVRLSGMTGFKTPHELCSAIAQCTGDQVHVIDIILWRYMAELPSHGQRSLGRRAGANDKC